MMVGMWRRERRRSTPAGEELEHFGVVNGVEVVAFAGVDGQRPVGCPFDDQLCEGKRGTLVWVAVPGVVDTVRLEVSVDGAVRPLASGSMRLRLSVSRRAGESDRPRLCYPAPLRLIE